MNAQIPKKTKLRFITLVGIITLVASTRLIPHMPNFSPLGAVALFGGAYLGLRWQALLIPVMATWIGDIFLNNVVYAAYFDTFTLFLFRLLLAVWYVYAHRTDGKRTTT